MFEIPGNKNIDKCIVTRDVIEKGEKPQLILKPLRARTRSPKAGEEKSSEANDAGNAS